MKFTTLVLVLAFAARDISAALAAAPADLPQFARGDCPVPDVRGLDERSASSQLFKHDLTPVSVTRYAPQPAGSVIAQQPAACSSRPANGRVEIVVSAGPGTSDGPSPQPGRTAKPPQRDGGGPSVGEVAVPIAVGVGIAVAAGLLSRRNSVEVPDLKTRPLDAATERLRRSQLRVGEVTRVESPTAPAGTVMDQSPAAGTRVARDTIVNVRVSSGRPTVAVPDVTLLEWQEAERLVSATGLRIVPMNAPAAAQTADAVVETQVPDAGTRVMAGASVGVTLRTPAASAVNQPSPPGRTPGSGPADVVSRPPVPSVAPGQQPAGPGPAQPAGAQAATPPAPNRPSPPGVPAAAVPTPGAVPPAAVPPGAVPARAVPAAPGVVQAMQPSGNVPVAPPRGLVVEVPPTTAVLPVLLIGSSWRWLWLLLLVALGSLAWRHARRAAGRGIVPPVVARLTVVPRLDEGRQAITTIDGGRSRAFDLALHRDEGLQRLQSDDTSSRVMQIGVVS